MVFLQNLLFYTLAGLVSLIYIPLAALCVTVVAIFARHRVVLSLVRRFVTGYGRLIMCCGWPFIRVEYRDLDPGRRDGTFLFVCNHRSASDPFLMATLPNEGIQVVNVWPFRLPVLGLCAKIAGYLSVHELPLDRFYAEVRQRFDEGVSVISFPEGTRSASRRMGPFTSSIFRVAQEWGATIVPLAISGNETIPRKGSMVLHPGRIRVHKLPAIESGEYRGLSVFELKNLVRDRLQAHLSSIEDGDGI